MLNNYKLLGPYGSDLYLETNLWGVCVLHTFPYPQFVKKRMSGRLKALVQNMTFSGTQTNYLDDKYWHFQKYRNSD